MPIDTSIYGQFAPRPVAIKSPYEIEGEALQVQQGRNQNRLADMQIQGAQRAQERQNKLAQLLQGEYATPEDREGALLKGGFVDESLKFGKDRRENLKLDNESMKAKREAEAAQFKLAHDKTGALLNIISSARDPQSYAQALQQAGAMGLDVSTAPQQYDPAFVANAGQQAQTAKERLEAEMRKRGIDIQALSQQESARHNRASEGLTARGQNMTDARTREFNATKVEENNIKRDEKKSTQDLTKASQIASFDTMLGTLDRLGKHPGLARSVGMVGAFPTAPGSNSANFQAELNTFQSQAFLPMVAQLKGMGALSDAEGKKLTAAVGALDPRMGEQAFRDSVARITEDMQAARARMTGEDFVRPSLQKAPSAPGMRGGAGANTRTGAGQVVDFGSLK